MEERRVCFFNPIEDGAKKSDGKKMKDFDLFSSFFFFSQISLPALSLSPPLSFFISSLNWITRVNKKGSKGRENGGERKKGDTSSSSSSPTTTTTFLPLTFFSISKSMLLVSRSLPLSRTERPHSWNQRCLKPLLPISSTLCTKFFIFLVIVWEKKKSRTKANFLLLFTSKKRNLFFLRPAFSPPCKRKALSHRLCVL